MKKFVLPPSLDKLDAISALVRDAPSLGNHDLYAVYRNDGGTVPWKVFRRAVAICRGGADADVEMDRIEDEDLVHTTRLAAMRLRTAANHAERVEREEREKHEKEQGGSTMTVQREELSRGQRVFVRVRYADQVKLRPACINQVMRGAVNVTIDDEDSPRTVRFNEIEVSPPTLSAVPPAFAALAEGRGERREPVVEMRRQAPPPPVAAPAVASAAPAATPSQTEDEVTAWIEKGASMRDNLLSKQAALQASMDEMVLETLRIEEALTLKKIELVRITTLLTALDQMRAVAAA
jgi:hypothetical protein